MVGFSHRAKTILGCILLLIAGVGFERILHSSADAASKLNQLSIVVVGLLALSALLVKFNYSQ